MWIRLIFLLTLIGILSPTWAAKKPNLIYILLDDFDALVSEPFLDDVMPFTMAAARRGANFQRNYSGVICCESRAAILTGLHAHNNGVLTNGGDYGGYAAFLNPLDPKGRPLNLNNETRTVAKYLSDYGYRTAMVGKYMNGFDPKDNALPAKPLGWTDGAVALGNSVYRGYEYSLMNWENGGVASQSDHGSAEADYVTDVLRDRTLKMIRNFRKAADEKPFFIYLTPTAPHFPIPPAPRHAVKTQKWEGTLPTNRPNYFADAGWQDKPEWLQRSLANRDTAKMREWAATDWRKRLGSLYAVDEMVEAITKELRASGELDNTVFILTSDNGYNLGAHALIHKMAPYEESVRVPLYVWSGKNIPLRNRTERTALTLHIDHAPTLLALAGAPIPAEMDGASLVPFLTGTQPDGWRTDFVQQYAGGEAANGIGPEMPKNLQDILAFVKAPAFFLDIPDHRSLTAYADRKLFVYIEWNTTIGAGRDRELYELTSDPFQLHNLVHRPVCQRVRYAMKDRLAEQIQCSGKNCNEGAISWPIGTKLCEQKD